MRSLAWIVMTGAVTLALGFTELDSLSQGNRFPQSTQFQNGLSIAQAKRVMRSTGRAMRGCRSISALGQSLMGVSKIADNPPGAAEQRQFEQQEREQRQMREQNKLQQLLKQRRMQKLAALQQQQQQQERDEEMQQQRAAEQYRPQYGRQQQYEPQQQWEPKQQQYYKPQSERQWQPEEEEIAPQSLMYGRDKQSGRPQYQPQQYGQDEDERPCQREKLHAEYAEELRQSGYQYPRFKRSFLSGGGLGLDIGNAMSLQSSFPGITDGQVRQDIGRSRFDPFCSGKQMNLGGYQQPQSFQPRIPISQIDYGQKNEDQLSQMEQSQFGNYDQQSNGFRPQSKQFQPTYADEIAQFGPAPVPGGPNMQPNLKSLPDRLPQSDVPNFFKGVSRDEMLQPMDKQNFMPSGDFTTFTAPPNQVEPAYAQEMNRNVAPAAASMQGKRHLFGPGDSFDKDFDQAPQGVGMNFRKVAESDVVTPGSFQQSLSGPGQLSGNNQLGASGQGLGQLDTSWG